MPPAVEPADKPGVLVFPPLLFGIAFLAVLGLRQVWALPTPEHLVAVSLGIALMAASVGIALWASATMNAAGTNVNPNLPSTAVVSGGPYRYSRNPMYVALMLLLVGGSLVVDTWWGLIVLLAVLPILHRGIILREERYLERKFGDTYRAYRSRVRRYL